MRHIYCCLCGWVFFARFAWRDIGVPGLQDGVRFNRPVAMWEVGYLLASFRWPDWEEFPGNRRTT